MLNISPKANGVIPADQQMVLRDIGEWLKKYGEAIYDTRTWTVYGEGPTVLGTSGHFLEWKTYTAEDVRFTTKENQLYAILMGWPGEDEQVKISSINRKNLKGKTIQEVVLLGSNEKVLWELTDKGFLFTTPSQSMNDPAVVLKLTLK